MEVANSAQPPIIMRQRLAMALTSSRLLTVPIIVILVVGAILRFNQITQPFTDLFSWRQSGYAIMAENFARHGWNIFYPEITWFGPELSFDGREFPLVSYLTGLLYVVFGQQDWVGRSLVALFGLWGIFALYQLVRRTWDEQHAIAAAAMLALLPGAIFFDRSFLPDPAMVALGTTSLWMMVSYFQTEKIRYLLLACIFGTLSFMIKLSGLVILIPMIYAVIAIFDRDELLSSRMPVVLTVALLSMLGGVVWYSTWAHQLALAYSPHVFAGFGIWVWEDGLLKWWNESFFLSSSLPLIYTWIWTGPVIGLVALGLLFSPNRAKQQAEDVVNSENDSFARAPWLFHCWLIGCILFYVIGARNFKDYPWNFHLFSPVIAALAGHGLVLIWSFSGRQQWLRGALARVAVVLLIVFGAGQLALPAVYSPKYASKGYEMGMALREMTQPSDLVITLASDSRDPVALYYSQRHGWVFPVTNINLGWSKMPKDAEAIEAIKNLRDQGARWLAIANDREDFWVDRPTLYKYIKGSSEFKVKTDSYVIYRLLTPDEIAKLKN